jgi:GT2 family glycosyltransferase
MVKNNVIIIPVHNQLPYLIKCVTSVIQKTANLELIIVDDGSDDETAEWIRENERLLHYKRIRHETAKGFSNACNDGIDYAMTNFSFDCLCLLNSDTEIITDHWFDKVRECFEQGEKIGVAGVISDNAQHQSMYNRKKYMSDIESKPTVFTSLVHGFCYFISRELIETIGKLDEDLFPHYGSEDDYSLKSITSGFNNLIVGSVLVHHKNNGSYSEKTRAEHLKFTMPALRDRWTVAFVDRCCTHSVNVCKYINNK